jgi:hypothetical protein
MSQDYRSFCGHKGSIIIIAKCYFLINEMGIGISELHLTQADQDQVKSGMIILTMKILIGDIV